MSIPAETPAAVISLPSSTTRSTTGSAPNLAERLEVEPVAGRAPALQQAGGAEDERAGADRGRSSCCRAVDLAHPVEHPLVFEQRPVAVAAGDEEDVGGGRIDLAPGRGRR